MYTNIINKINAFFFKVHLWCLGHVFRNVSYFCCKSMVGILNIRFRAFVNKIKTNNPQRLDVVERVGQEYTWIIIKKLMERYIF